MARKTTDIKLLLASLNTRLANPDTSVEYRKACADIAEMVLLDANQYAGFGYRDTEWDRTHPDGESRLLPAGQRDEYRRIYYFAHN